MKKFAISDSEISFRIFKYATSNDNDINYIYIFKLYLD